MFIIKVKTLQQGILDYNDWMKIVILFWDKYSVVYNKMYQGKLKNSYNAYHQSKTFKLKHFLIFTNDVNNYSYHGYHQGKDLKQKHSWFKRSNARLRLNVA